MLASLLNLVVGALLLPGTLSSARSINSGHRDSNATEALAVCKKIARSISNASAVLYPGNSEYEADINLPASRFNRANATCAVEPATNEDVAVIMTALRKSHVRFGVMGGGHNLNSEFSSTEGVLISMDRFNTTPITFLPEPGPNNETAYMDIGAGMQWHDIYTNALAQGVNVLGGRFATVGASGILLGGGYSWLSNRHALASDNVVEYTMIIPGNSSIVTVTNSSDPDLFFALKGGLNNFGIVTNFKVKAYPQTNKVWAGTLYIQPNNSDATVAALTNFSVNNTDPDAQVVGSFVYGRNQGFEVLVCFYNGENNGEPPAVFEEFLALPRQNQSDFYLRTFDNFTSASLETIKFLDGYFAQYSTISLADHPLSVVQAFQKERDTQGPYMNALDPSFFGSWTVEPFMHSYWDTAVDSAVPHGPALVTFPANLQLAWSNRSIDNAAFASIRTSTNNILQAAVDAGQPVGGENQIQYPNYALPDTPIANIYGKNLPRLRKIRSRVDPTNVMYRAGGYKIV